MPKSIFVTCRIRPGRITLCAGFAAMALVGLLALPARAEDHGNQYDEQNNRQYQTRQHLAQQRKWQADHRRNQYDGRQDMYYSAPPPIYVPPAYYQPPRPSVIFNIPLWR